MPETTEWGNIEGTLSNQTDLQGALDLKTNSTSLATIATSGSYNDLTSKPHINNVELAGNQGGNSLGLRNSAEIITDTDSTTITISTLQPNTYYSYETLTSLVITSLDTTKCIQESILTFKSGSSISVSLPNDIKIMGETSFESNKEYYLRFWNNTVMIFEMEKNGIPDGYTQVEYVEANGTPYIDTGIIPTTDMSFELNISFQDYFGAGVRNSVYGSAINVISFNPNTSTDSACFRWGGTTWRSSNYNLTGGNIYNIKFGYSSGYINNTQLKNDIDGPCDTINYTFWIFGYDEANSLSGGYFNNQSRLYSFKVTEGETLLANLIPCMRNSDSTYGVYDLISKTFRSSGNSIPLTGPTV